MPKVASVEIDVTTRGELVNRLTRSVHRREGAIFVGFYSALAYRLLRDPEYRSILAESITYPDGMGVVWALRWQGESVPARLATTDVVWDVMRLASERHWRVSFYGGRPGVAHRAAKKVKCKLGKSPVVYTRAGYDNLTADELRALKLDIIFVGRGVPLQEKWAKRIALPAGVPAIITCGGLFDFMAGDAKRAPRWMVDSGMEWLYRVFLEPRRLLLRYAVGNSLFVVWVAAELCSQRLREVARRSVVLVRQRRQ